MSDLLLVERDGQATIVTFNRPEKLNALTKAMWERLGDVIEKLKDENGLRCLVLRGAGGKAFSPGNDISEFESDRANAEQAKAYGALMHRALTSLRDFPAPTLALIEGICVGGGLEIAGCCDVRLCSENSRFGAPINKLGLVMAYPEIAALRALVGPVKALEILLEGRIFDAKEAYELGLVTRVVPADEFQAEATATLDRIVSGAPLVARWHKAFLKRLADPTPLSVEEEAEGYACYDSEDFQTGYRAFLAKEKPIFSGR